MFAATVVIASGSGGGFGYGRIHSYSRENLTAIVQARHQQCGEAQQCRSSDIPMGRTSDKVALSPQAFPELYAGTYQTIDYVRSNWGKRFEILTIVPPADSPNEQNTAVMRKRS